MSTVTTSDRVAAIAVLRLLLEESELISFKYDSGFTVAFQQSLPQRNKELPVQVSLVLRAAWWPTAAREVPETLRVQDSAVLCRPEQPYQAFKLMTFIGRKVERIEVDLESTLSLFLSGGNVLRVAGTDEEWEFSWYLFSPSTVPGADSWSINCDAVGNIEGCWPSEARIPECAV